MRLLLIKYSACVISTLLLLAVLNTVAAQGPRRVHRTVHVRSVPDSTVERMKNENDFRYANDSTYWVNDASRQTDNGIEKFLMKISESHFLRWILYFFLAGGILFAIYQVMIVNNFFILSRSKKNATAKPIHESEEFAHNLDKKISNSVQNGDYRHAIRYMYLKTLKMLNDDKYITLSAGATNHDYIRQMYRHEQLSQFMHLTNIYEYVWYGEFHPDEMQFELISNHFNRFNTAS